MPKKRISVVIDEEDYIRLRARLVLAKQTFSSWLRELINKVINDDAS